MRQSISPSNSTVYSFHISKDLETKKIKLTTREKEVLKYICQGFSMKEIAAQLFLSNHTIISHKRNLLEKFKAKNMVRLAVLAERYRLVPIV